MSQSIVAHRYAKSLLDLAIEKNVVDQVQKDMHTFADTCKESRALVLAFQSPIIKHGDKLAILKKLFQAQFHPVSFSIFEIITKKNRERFLPDIASAFLRLYGDFKGIQQAEVSSSTALTEAQRNQIIDLVKQYTGKEVALVEKVDEQLIGGFVLRVGDQQIDDSIRRKLNDLKISFAS